MAINLKSLSADQLATLISNARSQLEQSRGQQISEVRGKIEALLKSSGLTLAEVFPRQVGKGKAKGTVAAKYRNPEDPSQTWSGRGKRPLWLVAQLKKRGVTLDSLLIDGTAAPARKNVATKRVAKKAASKKTGKRAPARAAKKATKKTVRRARKG
ncbi:H-NS histone family protein [Dyella sp. LX-66]|uniref:H-NS histone family protein n=1 Tax=unclassified Dyella TaxID=2634549 RepID=UPI001BE03D33|nr:MULTISPECIES: H-NS histone family protein [unclassified Dyella]MBT2118848.1 H-NS histone family protein [Dyella sp. LX-1]MBT2140159.1 H-NS histone family protein [Dyella sp. LX-66]